MRASLFYAAKHPRVAVAYVVKIVEFLSGCGRAKFPECYAEW